MEEQELFVAGSSWVLAGPFSPCGINLEEGKGNNNWLVTKGKKEKFSVVLHFSKKKLFLLELLLLR